MRARAVVLVGLLLAPLFGVAGDAVIDSWVGDRRVQPDEIRSLAFVGSGESVVFLVKNEVRAIDPGRNTDARVLCEVMGEATAVALSPDGRRLLVATAGVSTISVHDVATGRWLRELPGVEKTAFVAWSPRGDRALAASTIGEAAVSSTATGARVAELKRYGDFCAAGFVNDGAAVFLSRTSNQVSILSVETGDEFETCRLETEARTTTAAISADGAEVAAVAGTTLVVRRRATGMLVWRMDVGEVLSTIAFSSDGRFVAGAGPSRRVRIFRIGAGEEKELLRHTGAVKAIAIAPGARRVCSTGLDGHVLLWDVRYGVRLWQLSCALVTGPVVYSSDGAVLLVGTVRGVAVVDPERDVVLRVLGGPPCTGDVAFLSSDKEVVALGVDSVARWPVAGGEPSLVKVPGVRRLVSADRAVALRKAGLEGDRFSLVDLVSKTQTEASETTHGSVSSLDFSADAKRALVASGELELWDTETLTRLHVFENCPLVEGAVGISADGKLGLAMHTDRKLRLWWLGGTWAHRAIEFKGYGVPSAIVFAPGNSWALVGTTDGQIHRVALPAGW